FTGGKRRSTIRVLDGVDDSLRAAVVGEAQRHGGGGEGVGRIGDADALIRQKVEQFVFLDGAAERGAELIAIQERIFLSDGGRGIVEERRRVKDAVLELLVNFAV